jgi:hypothetical protein
LVAVAPWWAQRAWASGEADPGAPSSTPAQRRQLPRLGGSAETTVRGKIVKSTRGEEGPVRLLIESESGSAVTVLVGPDSLCEHLGLSLRTGEQLAATGLLMPGDTPLLVARNVEVDGRTVRLRDEAGRWLPDGRPRRSPSARSSKKAKDTH